MKKDKKKLTIKIASGIFGSIQQSGKAVGKAMGRIKNWKLHNQLTDKFGLLWLFERIINVDINKVTEQVEKFRKKYPNDSIEELCDRLIKHKAFYTGTIGFTSGLIPANVPALLFDFVSTIGAEAELIYEIALVYGMDLSNNTRKGEVLTLIALGAGSTKTAEAALKLAIKISSQKLGPMLAEKALKNLSIVIGKKIAQKTLGKLIPIIGGIVGASLNASMVILTGKGAKAFYKNLNVDHQLYSGKLPEELKTIYKTQSIETTINEDIRDLIIAKTVIMILKHFQYSDESMLRSVEHNFSDLMNDYELRETLLQQIVKPSFKQNIFNQLDTNTTSIIITKSILCITTIDKLNNTHKSYFSKLAEEYNIPFNISDSLNQPDNES